MGIPRRLRQVANTLLRPIGFELNRFRYEGDSFPISPSVRNIALRKVVDTLAACPPVFDDLQWSAPAIEGAAREFFEAFAQCPIKQGLGGCGFNAGLLLFVSTRLAQPSLIVESGTFQGFTSWVFRTACPDAAIHCFDISFVNLMWRDPKTGYHQHDWSTSTLPFAVPPKSIAFFDDHVSQARRVVEATERGFRRLVFDDNFPLHAVHGDALPATPTVDMVFDQSLKDGDEVEWVSAGRHYHYRHSAAAVETAKAAIRRITHGPALLQETGYAPANLTFIETHPL